ncbi:MAG: ribosome small subunit-dependent GTPase A [FCB group bacterium]|nr:ribosome small subunit-dependent GTPase A [FCB group bacterium]
MRGRVKFKAKQTTPVAVGDDVIITISGDGIGVIESVNERCTVLSRPAVGRETIEHVLAANIDVLIIVVSVAEPPLKPGLIDRFLITAAIGGLIPVIVINKIDLGVSEEVEEVIRVYRSLGHELFLTSAIEETGLDKLGVYLKSHRSIFAGHSGVGKSTILNRILPGVDIRTAETSKATGKGRHTTSHMELFHRPEGGFIIDSPGIKVLGLWQIEQESLAGFYPEMTDIIDDCRFTGCTHLHEPDCAVKEALAEGRISAIRYQNYRQIYESLKA